MNHRASYLANGDVDLVGVFHKTWSVSVVAQCLRLSNLCAIMSVSLVKHQSGKVSSLRHFIICRPLFVVEFTVKNYRLSPQCIGVVDMH